MSLRTSVTTAENGSGHMGHEPHAARDPMPLADTGPTVPGSISGHWRLVVFITILGVVGAIGYTVHSPKAYSAKASIAMVQPSQNQGLTPVAANAQQYVESQVVVLQSAPVGSDAASIANAALHKAVFTAGTFSGPKSSVKLATQTATDPNAAVVAITFSARTPGEAAAGASALLAAYQNAHATSVQRTYSSILQTIDTTLKAIDGQLAPLAGSKSALDNQLATSLVNQRSGLLQTRSQALLDEQIALAQQPSTAGPFTPTSPANRKVVQNGVVGGVVGLVVAALIAYAIELIRRKKKDSAAVLAPIGTARNGSASTDRQTWDTHWSEPARDRVPTWSPGGRTSHATVSSAGDRSADPQ